MENVIDFNEVKANRKMSYIDKLVLEYMSIDNITDKDERIKAYVRVDVAFSRYLSEQFDIKF